jgi:signal transduction histidine kinase/ligand-binding sensor domain-containing protein
VQVHRPFHLFVSICALLCLMDRPAAGLDPKKAVTQYSLTQWGHRDGLPSTTIYAIAQTDDGFLWLGTADGLVRFDGVQFVQIPLSVNGAAAFGTVRALARGADGALWAGTDSGILVRLDSRTMKSLPLNAPISSIQRRPDSSVDVETASEVFRIASPTMQITATCRVGAIPAHGAESQPLQLSPLRRNPTECGARSVLDIAPSALSRAHLTADQVRSILRDSEGNLWVATRESGLFRVSKTAEEAHPAIEQLSVVDGLSSDSVWNILEDCEHNLWIGTENGLDRLRDDKFSTVSRRTGLLSNNIDSLAVLGNEIFAGSALGLNRVTTTGAVTVLHGSILSLAAMTEGSLFAGTPSGLAAIRNGRTQFMRLGVRANQITTLAQSSTGELWFYDRQRGLYRWLRGHAAVEVTAPALENKAVSVIQTDARGKVWLGLTSGEIVLYDGATFRSFSAADNLPGGVPHFIAVDSDGAAWIASEHGLAYYNGNKFVCWSRRNGLPGNRVLWAVRGPNGRLWLGYNIGVASVLVKDLLRAASDQAFHVPYDFYDEGDGIRGNPDLHGSSPVAVLPDGRLWFVTSEGLATIDPAHIRKNPFPPPVQILQVTANDVKLDITRAITLPPLTRRIEIHYTGLSLTDPRKVEFRYRLLNFDSQWHEASTRRFATYTNLPPGKYRFEVLAANNDGVWSTTPAVLAFTQSPAFHQTIWFIALCVATLLLAAIFFLRLRVRSAANRLRLRFEERLDERARVARDLHDNLLQEVMGISLQLEIADEVTPSEAAGKPMLRRALQLSESALAQGRGALTTLRAATFAQEEVLGRIKLAAASFPKERSEVITYHVGGTELPLQAGIGEEIVQIACEALRNALQHTDGLIAVRLGYSSRRFTLSVEDEGQGIDPANLEAGPPGHFGLQGMRERAARIAATLTIHSTADGGTGVRLVVPARMAYSGFETSSDIWARLKARWVRKPSATRPAKDE